MRGLLRSLVLILTLSSVAVAAHAAPWMWDQNQNRIDDRIEAVNSEGLAAAHVNHDLGQRLRLFVFTDVNPLAYGAYVGFTHHPTDSDVAALQAAGATVLWRPRYIDYVRVRASFAQIQAVAALAGITRVEAWQVMYAFNDNATRTLRARDAAGGVGAGMFPSVWKDLGYTGKGVVVGIIDTGVNDEATAPTYPGHQSLVGKFVGGGNFSNPDASLNTPIDGSENPQNAADPEGSYHATHVAGTAIGSGGPTGILNGAAPGRYAGMAPDARLVDCKALTDAGAGGGAAEALEWCIAHRNTVWPGGEPGVTYKGVQVVNLSLGGMDASDGTDADCAAVNAAVKAGIVACVATGNDGSTAHIPSPCAADLDVAVGSLEDSNTLPHGDDIVSSFSNEGPRTADGDADHYDEMKPSVLGSGSDIVSALGDPTTDGTRYHNINGTSMATPTIVGLCALIIQANPTLSPAQVRAILQNTAEHRKDHGRQAPSAADPFGLDPNYHPSWGWGEPDAYAAVKEALDANTTQVVSEAATSVALINNQLQIGIRWITQREIGVARFDVFRAPDQGGVAGNFAQVSSHIAPIGHEIIERTLNRTPYDWTDTDGSLVPGTTYWYQVQWTDSHGYTHMEPAFRVPTDVKPVRARVTWVMTHMALDNDVFARYGSGTNVDHASFERPAAGSGGADSVRLVQDLIIYQLNRYYFHADLTDDDLVNNYLPPSAANPWFFTVLEKGFVDTHGTLESFAVTVYDPTPVTYAAPNPPTPFVEGQSTTFWIPLDPTLSLNHTPVLDPIGARTVGEGLNLNFQVHATDADNQALTYSAVGVPLGASFNAGTRTFSWAPSFLQAGTYQVTFRATDTMAAFDEEVVTITVQDRSPGSNTAPVLTPVTDKATEAGVALAFSVAATDGENDALTFGTGPLPTGASFDAGTHTFHWTPAGGDQGTHQFTVNVADPSGAADSQAVVVEVTPGTQELYASSCDPDTTLFTGTIGADAQGTLGVATYHSFPVVAGTQQILGTLSWTGGPAIDLDLYLLDPLGNTVSSGATATSDPEHSLYVNADAGTYQWKVVSFDNPNPNLAYTITSVRCVSQPVGVGDTQGPGLAFRLDPNEPNPFTRSSVLRFALPTTGRVTLAIYDISGRRIRTLVNGTLEAGWHQRVWDGTGDGGVRAGSGIYFSRLEGPQGVRSRKMIMLQ